MLYFRMILVMGVSLFTSRVVLEQLGVEDYGIYNVVGGVVAMFSFLNGAMTQASQRFLSYELGRKSLTRLTQTFNASLSIHILIALVGLILAETLGLWFLNTQMTIPHDKMDSAQWVYQFAVLSFIVTIIRVPYNALIISHERMQIYAYLSVVEVLMKLGIVYLLAISPMGKLKIYAILMFVVCVVISAFYIYYSLRSFPESHGKFIIEREFFNPIMQFAGWSLFGTLAWMCKSQGVNIVLNIFFGPIVNAAYAIATQVNTAVNTLVQNFTTALNPQLVKNYAMNENRPLIQLLERGTKFSFLLLFIIATPLLLYTNGLLGIWLKVVPENAVIFTKLIVINALIESFAMVMGNAIQATGRIKFYQLIVGITILLNLPLSWVCLKLGFAPATVFIVSIGLSVLTIFERLLILRRNINGFSIRSFAVRCFGPVVCVVLLTGMSLWFINTYAMAEGTNTLVQTTLSMLVVGSIEFCVGLSSDERRSIIGIIKNRLQK